jgi:hypothetical protein
MSAKFILKKAADGQYRFVLKASNGETILTSELYTSKASAEKGIASVRENAGDDSRYVKKDAKNGSPMFNLRAGNNQVIGTSEMYSGAAARDGGIAAVKGAAKGAVVVDEA